MFESVNLIPNCITNLANFPSQTNFLTCPCQLFLFDPAIDAPKLRLKVILKLSNHLIFSLEFSPNNSVHLIISISQLISLMSTFFLIHLVFDLKLVLHVVYCTRPFFLLRKKSIDQISQFNFQTRRKLSIHLIEHGAKFLTVLKCINFYPTQIFFFFKLVSFQELYCLFESHQLNLHFFKNFVQKTGGCIPLPIHNLT
jgi:hypothetical protein